MITEIEEVTIPSKKLIETSEVFKKYGTKARPTDMIICNSDLVVPKGKKIEDLTTPYWTSTFSKKEKFFHNLISSFFSTNDIYTRDNYFVGADGKLDFLILLP